MCTLRQSSTWELREWWGTSGEAQWEWITTLWAWRPWDQSTLLSLMCLHTCVFGSGWVGGRLCLDMSSELLAKPGEMPSVQRTAPDNSHSPDNYHCRSSHSCLPVMLIGAGRKYGTEKKKNGENDMIKRQSEPISGHCCTSMSNNRLANRPSRRYGGCHTVTRELSEPHYENLTVRGKMWGQKYRRNIGN